MSKCLVVIDLQRGFLSGTEAFLDNLQELLDKKKFDNVVFFRFLNVENSQFELLLNWTRLRENHETAVIERFQKYSKIEFEHKILGVFSDEFKKYLKEKEVHKIYFSGIFTDVAVSKALMDAFDLGFEPVLIENCSYTLHGKENQENAIESIKRVVGNDRVIDSHSL